MSQIIDFDINRWINASCRDFFNSNRTPNAMGALPIPLYFEATGAKNLIDVTTGKPIMDYAEFRLDGPFRQQMTATETWYDIEINILCISLVRDDYSDQLEVTLGVFATAFQYCIPVFKYGDLPQDDQTKIENLILLQDKNEQVRVSRFGQANPDTRLVQGSVEGHYRLKLVGLY